MTAHTPTLVSDWVLPLRIAASYNNGNPGEPHSVIDSAEPAPLMVIPRIPKQYAALIVKAVNCHEELVNVIMAQHTAIDRLFAMLIAQSPFHKTFFPSESGQPWEALLKGNAILTKVGAK